MHKGRRKFNGVLVSWRTTRSHREFDQSLEATVWWTALANTSADSLQYRSSVPKASFETAFITYPLQWQNNHHLSIERRFKFEQILSDVDLKPEPSNRSFTMQTRSQARSSVSCRTHPHKIWLEMGVYHKFVALFSSLFCFMLYADPRRPLIGPRVRDARRHNVKCRATQPELWWFSWTFNMIDQQDQIFTSLLLLSFCCVHW